MCAFACDWTFILPSEILSPLNQRPKDIAHDLFFEYEPWSKKDHEISIFYLKQNAYVQL